MSTITVADVKLRLKKTNSTDDTKIQKMIDAAEAAYVRWVGPITGTVTEVFDGGTDTLILRDPGASAITAASYESGDSLTSTDLNVSNGIVRWNYSTAGRFTPGTRVSITYTVGTLPADHEEAIIADVAGYYVATQRGGDIRADFPGDGYAETFNAAPMTLFPRIQALAGPAVA